MKILITGAAGFIGFHLINKLVKLDNEIVGIDNINNYYDINLKLNRLLDIGIEEENIQLKTRINSSKYSNLVFIKSDIEDKLFINELFVQEKFDLVINLAAQAGVRYSIENPDAYIKTNIVGFNNILEACKLSSVKKVLFASSSSVYGKAREQPFNETYKTDTPVSMYAATKISNELMAHVYSHLYNIQVIGLRFFTVYGPWGRPDMAPFIFADAMKNNKSINVFNNGEMHRDFTYISDIVEGIVKLVNSVNIINKYEIFNIGNSKPINLLNFINCLENEFEVTASKNFKEIQPGDVKETWADISKLKTVTDYKPEVDVKKGVKLFVEWYKDYYA